VRIAQVAPLIESVPPTLYGGTERVVSYLTEELVRQGHEITLFASGDSETSAELVPCVERALRLHLQAPDPVPYYMMMLEQLRRRAAEFDVIHFHIEFLHFPLCRAEHWRCLTTLHGRLDFEDTRLFYNQFDDLPLVSISDNQREPLPAANWVGTVHHGLPRDLYPCNVNPRGTYLAFLGRLAPEKRPDRAIEIAQRAGLPLKIAAKVDSADQAYFDNHIKPLLTSPSIEFVGEIGEKDKSAFLGEALALLVPIDWPEPFGLVIIEAMACGTPVIAWPRGSVPELIQSGLNGFIVDSVDAAARAAADAAALDRKQIRACFEKRFTAERMGANYVSIYRSLTAADRLERRGAARGRNVSASTLR
jgi:glycosyltransferase involved in cell wall biosynthesis